MHTHREQNLLIEQLKFFSSRSIENKVIDAKYIMILFIVAVFEEFLTLSLFDNVIYRSSN